MKKLLAAILCAWPWWSFAGGNGADIAAGRALFIQKGCYECHGLVGQGSATTGPALAPHPLALTAMQAYVHGPKGEMPIYSRKILSDSDVAQIHAYLDSIPPDPPLDSIALLADGAPRAQSTPSTPSTVSTATPGASIYAAHCAACHGTSGEGGVGPALLGIARKYGIGDIETRIKQPSGIMPRLYPEALNAQDVQDVARYVASLK